MKQGFRVMDSDLHLFEPPDIYDQYLEDRFKSQAPKYVPAPGNVYGDWLIKIPGQGEPVPQFPSTREALVGRKKQRLSVLQKTIEYDYGPESMLKAMDVEGIDVAVAFTTRSRGHVTIDDLDPEYAIAVCRAFNDYLADFCGAAPDRLKGCALLTLHSVELAVEEARRAVKDLSMVGLTMIPNPINGRYLHDPECDLLWKELQELDVPVCFHETNVGYNRGHLSNWLRDHPSASTLTQMFAFSPSLMQAIGSLIFGGVLDRFPKLRVAFLEGNCSWLPWLLWRLDEHWEMYREWEPIQLSMKPSGYLLRQGFVSMETGETYSKYVVDAYGDDILVTSTDWPHFDSAYPHAIDNFLGMPGINDETKRKVLWDNCARLYNL